MATISIRVARTVQVKQYEPVTVEVIQTVKVDDDADEETIDKIRLDTYKKVTGSVKKFIDNEQRKYGKEAEE